MSKAPEVVQIESLGHRGDGIGRGPGGLAYVPFTLPGESVAIDRRGDRGSLLSVLEASGERTLPICRHFGRCGGCALQMMSLDAGRALKRRFVIGALNQQKIEADVAETVGVDPASRRRAVMTALRVGRRIVLGYSERLSNRLIDIEECPILVSRLEASIPAIRAFIEPFVPAKKPVRVTALLTRGGLDINLEGAQPPSPRALPRLTTEAQAGGIVRLSLGGEPILSLGEAAIEVAGIPVTPPPGAFIQASAEAETIMADMVVSHLAGAQKVADLFCGFGTFALALARHAAVRAVENNPAALEGLSAGLRRGSGLKHVETERRDLFTFPLSPAELNGFDGVVFDPPRAGAKAQAEALAASTVPRIAAISCNPASFARDARILLDGGYRLTRVVPVDQFVFSAETEVVGLFERPPRAGRAAR